MPIHRAVTTIATALVGVAALTTGCGDDADDAATAAAPTTAPTGAHGSPSANANAHPIEGTWRAGPAPMAEIVAALEEAGWSEFSGAVLQGHRPSSRLTSDLKVQGGHFLLAWSVDDETLGVQDRQAYTASGTTVELSPSGLSCLTTFNWTVAGDQLRFALVDDTCPDYQGTPDEAIMVGLYAALPFERVSS